MEQPPLAKRELTLEERVARLEQIARAIADAPGNPFTVADEIRFLLEEE